ncbi:ariadne ring protein [Colletotrichum truncatum]|uniref:Ariadne ring protein n=1 Tax=Colletotrichum truncatum TaxID=5467 RepID=A0ACC3YUA0_COLTU|nr:ariadne ring protein [Colletotrichum truncatum]KAF6798702.1 ariadne ring protein [Colletotrichum truncatum]
MVADVRVEDPNFAKSLCDKYDSGEFKIHDPSDFKVFALAVPASKGTTGFTHRVTCKKVVCSWHKPMRVALLSFDSEFLARDICDRFSTGTYKVLGTKVSCSFRSVGSHSRHVGDWRRFAEDPRPCVLALRVPLAATTEDVLRMIPRGIRPRNVEFDGLTYRVGKEYEMRQLAMIERLLTKVGPLEMGLTANMDAPGKRVKAMARFKDETDAKEAARSLHETRLPFYESDKLDVNLLYSATYKVATKVFEAVSADVDAARVAYREMYISFKSFPPANGYTTLRLEGENREDLAAAEKIVDRILKGETVMADDGEKPFWSPSLGNRVAAGKTLGRIEQEFQVAFHCVPSKAEISMFGAPGKLNKARDALLKAFGDSPSSAHTIMLDDKSFQWAIRGGFQALRDTLGPENVALSILPTLKSIEVLGPRSSYDLAVDIMSGKKPPSQLKSMNQTDECCSVCWTEAERPLTTKCGHVYCLDCFENFCQSADSGENGYSLRCLADEGSCGAIFSLPELQEHLSSLTFEELLTSSVKSYISKHPNEFRYCPTADCERVYRASPPDRPGLYRCPGCFKATCSSCHFSHEGKSCAEHKYIASGGEKEFQQAKERLGIKDCPKCNTSIQKSEGCNHI